MRSWALNITMVTAAPASFRATNMNVVPSPRLRLPDSTPSPTFSRFSLGPRVESTGVDAIVTASRRMGVMGLGGGVVGDVGLSDPALAPVP